MDRRQRLAELARVFLRLGAISFGGPAAHVAMMEEELVRRRGWISREGFLDLLGASNLIPGPNSTELAIHLGRERAGWAGLLVAGTAFILPAFLMVLGLAWAYTRFGARPEAGSVLYGVKPVIIAIVLQALWALGRTAVKGWGAAAGALAALALAALGVHELLVLLGLGLGFVLVAAARRGPPAAAGALAPWPLLAAAPATAAAGAVGLLPLFLLFLKVGAVLFGSGYVLLAFLRADLVERRGWLTEGQLLDAVAMGQLTPGPLSTTATFVGYLLRGLPGAAVATVGIFLPAFLLVAASGPLVPRLRASPLAGAFLDGVNLASLALMALVTLRLGQAALVDLPTAALFLLSAALLLAFRLGS
ncbi:MAG TPA: chromate efflux transporter, partial [Vicinamibacteria bacterium]